MNRLVCQDCGTVYYSAAAKTMAEQGERCAKCGGRLLFADGPKPAGRRRPEPTTEIDYGVNFTVMTSPSRIT